jgi:hypothetical protein
MIPPRALRRAAALAILVPGLGAAKAAPVAAAGAATEPPAVAQAVAESSARFSIPPDWIRAVMRVESGGNARALSPKGAIGLMQIMPDTWRTLRRRYSLGDDPYDAHDNILGGTALLREFYDRFGAGGFLAAYNAGPSRYLAFLTQGRPLELETQIYLAKLAALLPGLPFGGAASAPPLPPDWRTAPLFASAAPMLKEPAWAAARPGSPSAAVPPPNPAPDRTVGAAASPLAPDSAGLFAALTPAVSP